MKSFFSGRILKYVLFGLLILVVLSSVFYSKIAYCIGYTDKKAQSIIEEMFPTCEVTGVEDIYGDMYVRMQSDKGVEFTVVYEGRQKFRTNYGNAVVNASIEKIKNECPDGITIKKAEDWPEDGFSFGGAQQYRLLYIYIDGEEYLEDAAKYCVTIQNILNFQCVRPKETIYMRNGISIAARFLNPKTGEYEESEYGKKISFCSSDHLTYEDTLEWLKTEYDKMKF